MNPPLLVKIFPYWECPGTVLQKHVPLSTQGLIIHTGYYETETKSGRFNQGHIEKICTVSGADIRAVLYVMVDVAIDNFAKGTIIRLGDLRSLRVTLSSKGEATAEKAKSGIHKRCRCYFHARLPDPVDNGQCKIPKNTGTGFPAVKNFFPA